MRWLKHLALTSRDETIAALISEFGVEAYGVYWIILETIALQMKAKDDCAASYSIKDWSNFCRISTKKFQKIISFLSKSENFCSKKSLFFIKKEGSLLRIICPKLLKYKDEYTRKQFKNLGQTPDKLRTSSGQTPAQETEYKRQSIEREEKEKKYKRKEKETASSSSSHLCDSDESHGTACKILNFLNEKTGHLYRPVSANLDLIKARLKSGATVIECRQIICRRMDEWQKDPAMSKYLRPATLFCRLKFEQYLGELRGIERKLERGEMK